MALYRLETWRIAANTQDSLVMRPSGRTLANRLGLSLACLLLAGCLFYAMEQTPSPAARQSSPEALAERAAWERESAELAQRFIDDGTLTAEQVAEIQTARKADAAAARAESTRLDRIFRGIFQAVMAFFAFLALLAPASLTWERVRIGVTPRGEFSIRRRDSLGLPSERRFPRGALGGAALRVREHQQRTRMGYAYEGWLWEAVLRDLQGNPAAAFTVDWSKTRPRENQRPPEKVRAFAEALSRLAGCSVAPGYGVAELRMSRAGPVITGTQLRETGPVKVQSRTMRIDEAPPELRQALEDRIARGESGTIEMRRTHQVNLAAPGGGYVYRAPDGTEHHCERFEDLPPEIQRLIREARQGR